MGYFEGVVTRFKRTIERLEKAFEIKEGKLIHFPLEKFAEWRDGLTKEDSVE